MIGWVKIHRKLKQWEWYGSPNHVALFVELLISANFHDSSFRGQSICRGELLTGRKKLAEETGLSEQSVRTVLRDLQSTNEITIKSMTKFSIISIVNYEDYQDANQQTNQQSTSVQPTANQQVTTSQERKKNKKKKNISCQFDFESVYQDYPRKEGRSKGIDKLNREIKTPEDYALFSRAVKNYSKKVDELGAEKRFIKHFSTFVTEWRDHLGQGKDGSIESAKSLNKALLGVCLISNRGNRTKLEQFTELEKYELEKKWIEDNGGVIHLTQKLTPQQLSELISKA